MAARSLPAAVVRFGTLLRRQGLPATPLHVADAVRALEHLDLGDRGELYLGLRAVFVSRPEDIPTFDRCFEEFWRTLGPAEPTGDGLLQPLPAGPNNGAAPGEEGRETLALEEWGAEADAAEDGDEPLGVPAASEREALATRDFSTFSTDQLDELYRLTIQIARRLPCSQLSRMMPATCLPLPQPVPSPKNHPRRKRTPLSAPSGAAETTSQVSSTVQAPAR